MFQITCLHDASRLPENEKCCFYRFVFSLISAVFVLQIIIGNGAISALCLSADSIVRYFQGLHVQMSGPYWVSYRRYLYALLLSSVVECRIISGIVEVTFTSHDCLLTLKPDPNLLFKCKMSILPASISCHLT
jgi:hypothetical protein